ncbi:MAG: hypothetical protein JW840_04810 [Candidatus Thermoplasmatota archaeon]|nr:hypothetical protein [Candidatus Thermoplasmatota archaeon]
MKKQKKGIYLFKNDYAVLGLPLRLTVSLLIGTIVLLSILSSLLNPCIFPERMVISVTPLLTIVPGNNPENVTFTVRVQDTNGHPLNGASIIIKGLGGAGAGSTDEQGTAKVEMQIQLDEGFYEGYLDILVKAPCHESFEQQDMIKVVKSNTY